MAKQKRPAVDNILTNPLASTTPPRPAEQAPEDDPIKAIGLGLKQSEGDRLKEIAAELGTNRHALLLWLARDFMRKYDSGERPPTETVTITVLKK